MSMKLTNDPKLKFKITGVMFENLLPRVKGGILHSYEAAEQLNNALALLGIEPCDPDLKADDFARRAKSQNDY